MKQKNEGKGGTRRDEHVIDNKKTEQLSLMLGGILSIFLNINLSPRHPTGEGNLESTRDKRLRVKLPSSKSNRLEEAKVALRCPGGITIPEKLPTLSALSNGDCCNPVTACAHPDFQP